MRNFAVTQVSKVVLLRAHSLEKGKFRFLHGPLKLNLKNRRSTWGGDVRITPPKVYIVLKYTSAGCHTVP